MAEPNRKQSSVHHGHPGWRRKAGHGGSGRSVRWMDRNPTGTIIMPTLSEHEGKSRAQWFWCRQKKNQWCSGSAMWEVIRTVYDSLTVQVVFSECWDRSSSSLLLWLLGQALSISVLACLSGFISCHFLPHILCSTYSDRHGRSCTPVMLFPIRLLGKSYLLFKEQLKCHFLSTAIPDHMFRQN